MSGEYRYYSDKTEQLIAGSLERNSVQTNISGEWVGAER